MEGIGVSDATKSWFKDYWFDLVLYILIILLIWTVVSREMLDLSCDDEDAQQCDGTTSMALAPGKVDDSDSVETILSKIAFTARYEHNTVVWRRAFLTSVVLSFIILYIMKRKFPRALDFIVVTTIIFLGLYLAILIWQPLVVDKAVAQIDENIIALENKL